MTDIPVIQCAVCGRPVDRVEAWRVVDSFVGTEIQVWCHGATDRMFLSDETLAYGPIQITEAVAFRPSLPEAQANVLFPTNRR